MTVKRIERSTTVDGAPEVAWSVLADFGGISAWVPLVQHSCLLSEQTDGVGAVRRVQIGRQAIVERVVTWEPAHRLAYDLEGLPPMVGVPRTTWTLASDGEGTLVTLTTEIDPGRNPVRALAAGKALERMSLAAQAMLAGLTAAVAPTPQEERA